MLIEALLLSIILGYLRGGRLSRLASLDIKYPWIILVAFLIQFILPRLKGVSGFNSQYGFYLLILSYVLLILVVLFNLGDKLFQIIGIGVFLNFLVILLNKGMPVSLNVARRFFPETQGKVLEFNNLIHVAMTEKTYFDFLGDVIPIPRPYPFPGIISIGDIILSVGIFLLVQKGMVYRGKRRKKVKAGVVE